MSGFKRVTVNGRVMDVTAKQAETMQQQSNLDVKEYDYRTESASEQPEQKPGDAEQKSSNAEQKPGDAVTTTEQSAPKQRGSKEGS